MSSNLDVILKEIGMKYEDAVWDCRGTNVILHKAIERIATHKKIKFDEPKFLECNTEKKIVSLMVTGTLGDKSEWSIGEASPSNNKNNYPYAMAEKRAKDRVVLKLVDLSGDFYSEDEADDFKDAKPQGEVYEPEMIDFLKEAFTQFMVVQHTKEEVQSFYKNNSKILGNLQANHNSVYEEIKTVFKDRIKEIQNLTIGDKNG
jgi:hypothetical protein